MIVRRARALDFATGAEPKQRPPAAGSGDHCMNGSQTFERLSREALDAHRQIHFYLDQISQSVDRLREGLSDVEPLRRLAAEIEGLQERLAEHLHAEESGLFQSILDALPACRVEIDRLANQHGRMIEVLEMARLHAQRGEVAEADALRVDFQGFLAMFREHEQAEERLLAEALKQTVDTPD